MASQPEGRDADRICYRMQRIRRSLDHKVDDLRANAEQLMDWRYYVRRYPWESLAASLAAGFLLIPWKKSKSDAPSRIYLDQSTARELTASGQKLVVEQQNASPGIVKAVALMGANMLVRTAISQIGQSLGQRAASRPGVRADSHEEMRQR